MTYSKRSQITPLTLRQRLNFCTPVGNPNQRSCLQYAKHQPCQVLSETELYPG